MICAICLSVEHRSSKCPKRISKIVAAAAVTLMLAGCAKQAPYQAVTVAPDSYCKAAKPLSYSRNDTTETIEGNRRHNAGYRKRCGGK